MANNSFIPNSFQLPNALIDSGILADLSSNDLKCYLVVVRKTAGWHKEWDFIPTPQLMEITGIKKRQTIYNCMEHLENFNLIESLKEKGKTTKYKLKVVPFNGTTNIGGGSTVDGYGVVPLLGTPSSTVDGYTSKDTTKTTITKTIKNKQKEKTNFELFVEKTRDIFKENKISTFSNKINSTKKTKEAFYRFEIIPDDLYVRYADYITLNRNMGVTLDKWLTAVLEKNESDINYGVEKPYNKKEPIEGSLAWRIEQKRREKQKQKNIFDVEVVNG